MSVFLNTKVIDSKNKLENFGNLLLTPYRYLCNGKDYKHIDAKSLQCSPSFPLHKKTFLKTVLAVAAFIPSTILGAIFKGLGHLSRDARYNSALIKNYTPPTNGASSPPKEPTKPGFIDHKALAKKDLAKMSDDEMDSNWRLNEFFGNIQIINLDHLKDKYKECTDSLKRVGLKEGDYERFSAVLGKGLPKDMWDRCQSDIDPDDLDRSHQNQTGCYMSHYTIIKQAKANYDKAVLRLKKAEEAFNKAKENNSITAGLTTEVDEAKTQVRKYSSTLILEDDNKFGRLNSDEKAVTQKKVGRVFREAMSHLPEEWDMFLFSSYEYRKMKGAPPFVPDKRVKKLFHGYDLNAYAVSARFYDTALETLKKIEEPGRPFEPVDNEYAEIMKDHRVYVATPPLSVQGGCESTIRISKKPDPYIQRNRWQWDEIKPAVA